MGVSSRTLRAHIFRALFAPRAAARPPILSTSSHSSTSVTLDPTLPPSLPDEPDLLTRLERLAAFRASFDAPPSADDDAVGRFLTAAQDAGWILAGFNWRFWNDTAEATALREPGAVAQATTGQLAALLTVLVRHADGPPPAALLAAIAHRAGELLAELEAHAQNRSSSLLARLPVRDRRGSKPRCHWLTHGDPATVARRLTSLVSPWATVDASDRWMPAGFDSPEEAQLHKAAALLPDETRRALADWWLPPDRREATSPSFDLAGTCAVGDRPGLLLVEAKAHDEELRNESGGRRLRDRASPARRASHASIKRAIDEAAAGLADATGAACRISRDAHYQMSNRFAWAWKLASIGIPAVLVYLGFLEADEMADRGRPFRSAQDWEALVRAHAAELFERDPWNRQLLVHGTPLIPIIRSATVAHDRPIDT